LTDFKKEYLDITTF